MILVVPSMTVVTARGGGPEYTALEPVDVTAGYVPVAVLGELDDRTGIGPEG